MIPRQKLPDTVGRTVASVTSPTRPDDADPVDAVDWSFARRPFWAFSHLFALAVVVLFVNLGLWQLGRHDERRATNAVVAERVATEALEVVGADDLVGDPADLDYRPAAISGTFLDDDFVRVVNRSQGGVAGEYVVGVVELTDGSLLAVNRGFVPANADPAIRPSPDGPTTVTGWLRQSVAKGRLGADDSGRSDLVPRMNTDDLAARLQTDLPAVWLQVATEGPGASPSTSAQFPDPVPLPASGDGPHLGYAAQWFIFATLGVLFYGALLRRQSRSR